MSHKVSNSCIIQMYFALFLVASGLIICSRADVQNHDIYPEATCQQFHNECHTLSDIVTERDKYFASDTMLVFHEGEHILQAEVSVSNISNFMLQGYSGSGSGLSSPTITCVNSSLFLYHLSIAITSIVFNHCSISLSHAAAVVQDSRFENGSAVNGGALAVLYSSVQFSGTNSFTDNVAEWYGGAIYAEQSALTFSGSVIFAHNRAKNGGAVYCGNDARLSFSFNGNNSFMSNAARLAGGAVYAKDNNTLRFDGSNRFMSNAAEWIGGAVHAEENNTLSFNGNSSFMSNAALSFCGAVTALDSNNVSFNGDSSFMSNTAEWNNGGAVCAVDRNTLTFNGNSSFMSNTADSGIGGAVYAEDSNTLSFNGNTSFMSNTAVLGGAVGAIESNTLSFNGTGNFMNNTAHFGGAVLALFYNTLSFIGNSSFISNMVDGNGTGGAVYARENNTLSFNGKSSFMNNTTDKGGTVRASIRNTLSFNGNSSFMNNIAKYGGAVNTEISNTLSFNGTSSFMNNTADDGGAVSAWSGNTLSFNGNSRFMRNTARTGGAVCAWVRNTVSFSGNSGFSSNMVGGEGGAVCAGDSNTLNFTGNSNFSSNTAEVAGGAMSVARSSLSFYGSSIIEHNEAAKGGGFALFSTIQLHLSSFGGGAISQDSSIDSSENIRVIGNKAVHGGGLFVQSSEITFQGTGLLAENIATNPEGGYGGAILSRNSKVEFQGFFDITKNTAEFGGGLALFGVYDSVLIIKIDTNLTFEGNLAHRLGGAIYREDDPFTFCAFDNAPQNYEWYTCFFQTRDEPYDCIIDSDHNSTYLANSITLKFDSNIANVSGDIMYGGQLESCVVCTAYSSARYTWGVETFHWYAESETDVFSKLSSDPYKVCICENGYPICDLREVNRTVYPGQVLVISVVAVGQMNGTVPSVIRAISDHLTEVPDLQETQPKKCSQLQYSLFSIMPNTTLKLYSDEPCSTSGYPLTLLIEFLPCPVGFTLSKHGACICDERLQKYTQNCNIETLTISRNEDDSFWVGVEGGDKLILHPHCPFDYCTQDPTYFPLNSTDIQCANKRSGILCGACQPGHGLALGSSRCLSDCSNGFLALLLAFAIAGVALVAFLFLCHLTVAEGTLSGLIFYANILTVNQTVFFPSGERNVLTVFIAWLNLDLGIETCFFVSLDDYYRTWLQFAFPIYIWVMVGVIIVLADRLTAFAKIIGNTNPVAVLATLFLLSYTKLLRAIMAAFSFTSLDYSDGDSKYVWLYDGNIGYLDRKDARHIALFFFSLLFLLFIFLPYTLLLLCGRCIQKQLWWFSSAKQLYLKFFLDAHYGPYNNQHHYWTGLLLLLRFVMLFVGTITNINNPQDPHSNLFVILIVSSSLIAWSWFVGRIYKKWYHNVLEGLFILHLVVLAGATYQVRQSGGNQAVLVYTSVSIAFITFIGIVISAVVKQMKEKVAEHWRTAVPYPTNNSPDDEEDSVQLIPGTATPTSALTYSVLEIVRHHPNQTSGEIELRPLTSASPGSTSESQ